MWEIKPAVGENGVPLQKNRRDFYRRKYPEAMRQLEKRLEQLQEGLDGGIPLQAVLSRGWVHPEKGGVFAVCVNHPALRLYFLPLPEKKILLILNIGDKNRQSADVIEAAQWAKSMLSL